MRSFSAARPILISRPNVSKAGAGAAVIALSASVLLASVTENADNRKVDISAVKKDIADSIEADADKRDDGTSIGPTLLRLCWHACGTYSVEDGTGGSGGAHMRFPPEANWGCNAGLASAREFMEVLKSKYPQLSYADLWTLAGVVAVEAAGGPSVPWRAGREDAVGPTAVPDGRLPDADCGCPAANITHIRAIFNRLGMNDREMVALIGAHCLGRCHENASGYWGPWTNAETTFSNDYFVRLLQETWTVKKTHNGRKWTGPMQFENKSGTIMMLPNDIALIQDAAFKKIVTEFANDEAKFFKEFSGAFLKLTENGSGLPSRGLLGLGFLGL